MKSATDLLLNKTFEVIWRRGEAYANSHKVSLLKRDEKETEAVAQGTKQYAVYLKFAGSGMSRSCTCPYQGEVCKLQIHRILLGALGTTSIHSRERLGGLLKYYYREAA